MKSGLIAIAAGLLGAVSYAQVAIGVNLELSGRMAGVGAETLRGIEAANEQVSQILGQNVKLVVCDNETTREGSVACAQRFVGEGVVAVLGTISTSMSIPAAEILQDAGIVMISTGSTNPQTTQIGDYIFRMAYTDDYQGVVAARYAVNEQKAKKIAIFRQVDDDYAYGLAEYFEREATALGASVQAQDFVAGTVDFTAQINNVRAFGPDLIYYAGFCAEGAPFLVQLRQQGFMQPVIGPDAVDDQQCPDGAGAALNGTTFTAFAVPELIADPEAKARAEEFRTAFVEKYGADAFFGGFALAGADAYFVVAHGLEQAGEANSAALQKALAELENYPGVSGNVTYKGTDGTPKDRTIGFYQYQVPGENGAPFTKTALFGRSTEE